MAEYIEVVDNTFTQTHKIQNRTFGIKSLTHADSRQVLNEIALFDGIKILDIGCGTGKLLFSISDLIKNCELHGIDLNRKMIKRAENKVLEEENIAFKNADAARLPYPDNYFHILVCTNTFDSIEHKGRALQEAHRVLQKHGRLFILESLSSDSSKNKLDKIIRQSPFIKYSRKFLKRTALLCRSYLITCQK